MYFMLFQSWMGLMLLGCLILFFFRNYVALCFVGIVTVLGFYASV